MERLRRAFDLPCLAGAAVLVRGRRETAGKRRPGGARDAEIAGFAIVGNRLHYPAGVKEALKPGD